MGLATCTFTYNYDVHVCIVACNCALMICTEGLNFSVFHLLLIDSDQKDSSD